MCARFCACVRSSQLVLAEAALVRIVRCAAVLYTTVQHQVELCKQAACVCCREDSQTGGVALSRFKLVSWTAGGFVFVSVCLEMQQPMRRYFPRDAAGYGQGQLSNGWPGKGRPQPGPHPDRCASDRLRHGLHACQGEPTLFPFPHMSRPLASRMPDRSFLSFHNIHASL